MNFPSTFNAGSDTVNVIIETPKGSSNKYNYDEETGLFRLSKTLPQGIVFPAHFGFLPHTKGEDGDPLDVLVLLDEATYPGCLVECRILGVIEAEQTERTGKKMRNDRIIAAAIVSQRYTSIKTVKELDAQQLEEITNFFITYNDIAGKKFKPLGYKGIRNTIRLIKKQQLNP